MIRVLGYVVGFAITFTIILASFYALLLLFMAALAFITWSMPLASPFNLVVLRIFVVLASILSVSFLLSKEGREAVDEFEKGFKRGMK